MRTEIARLHRSLNTTMIYVTHDQVEAMTLGQRIVVLNDGVVQQIDQPMKIYERPANLFVAGFLGNPAMNLLKGRLENAAGMTLAGSDARLPLGVFPRATLATHAGREIVAGIRPEDLQRTPPSGDALQLQVVVDLIESVGNESFIHARCGSWPLLSRGSPHDLPAIGSTLTLYVEPRKVHFFDGEGGGRIGETVDS
jgi:multiple sugar transport system ATP-binding protein